MRPLSLVAPLALSVILAGCASEPVMQDGIRVNDPFERQNRRVHAFNKAFDERVVAPVARLASPGDGASDSPGAMDLVINAGSNLSLPGGCGDAEYTQAFEQVIEPKLRSYNPQIVIVSAGYDAREYIRFLGKLPEGRAHFAQHP